MNTSIHFATTKEKKQQLSTEAKKSGLTLSNYVRLKIENAAPIKLEI